MVTSQLINQICIERNIKAALLAQYFACASYAGLWFPNAPIPPVSLYAAKIPIRRPLFIVGRLSAGELDMALNWRSQMNDLAAQLGSSPRLFWTGKLFWIP